MYPLFVIAKNNIKKKKGDVAVLFLLIALAVLLLYTSISVLTGVEKVFDQAYEKAHTADFMFLSNVGDDEKIEAMLLCQKEVTEYDRTECLLLDAEYRKNQSLEKSTYTFRIGAIEDERSMNKLGEIDINDLEYDNILLPYYMKSSYQQGDPFYFTFENQEYKFTVAGFVEDPIFATPISVTVYGVYITKACMDDIMEEHPSLSSSLCQEHKVRLKTGENTIEFNEKMSAILVQNIPELTSNDTWYMGMDWITMRDGNSVMSNMSMSIILIFSILLVLVALIIVRFSIRNFIELNLQNIGILQASGYTTRQLMLMSVLESGFIAFWGILAGIMLGVLGNGIIGNIQGMMIGISWSQNFNLSIAILIMMVVFLAVIGVAAISSMVYGKLTVLDALRGGVHTHNFRKNYFSFEKSRLPISLILSGKNIMGDKIKNLFIFCIIAILSFTTCMGFALYENFAVHTDKLLDLSGIEVANAIVSGDNLEEIGEKIEGWDEIETVLSYNGIDIKLIYGENQRTVSCNIWDEPKLLQHEMIIRGRFPEYDNEIVLSNKIAKELGVDVGDIIYVEGKSEKLDYMISGIDQMINHMGLNAMMTMNGAERLNGRAQAANLYIYTKEGTAFETIQDKILEQFPEVQISDREKLVSETISGMVVGMTAICIVFVLITFFVVIMVEVLLIHAKVVKEQKNYGISKALGYTTMQLIIQTMMTNIPVILIGSIVGAILSRVFGNSLAVICFSMFGIEQCKLFFSFTWMIFTIVGSVIVALGASFLTAMRIRKIEPVKMLGSV